VETEAYLGSGCGVVVMSETASKWACALLERVVSHPVTTRPTRTADRTTGTDLILLRRAEFRVEARTLRFDVHLTRICPTHSTRSLRELAQGRLHSTPLLRFRSLRAGSGEDAG